MHEDEHENIDDAHERAMVTNDKAACDALSRIRILGVECVRQYGGFLAPGNRREVRVFLRDRGTKAKDGRRYRFEAVRADDLSRRVMGQPGRTINEAASNLAKKLDPLRRDGPPDKPKST